MNHKTPAEDFRARIAALSREQLEQAMHYLHARDPRAMDRALELVAAQHDHDDADLPWTSGAHAFIPCTGCTADACNACGRAAADAVHQPAQDDPEDEEDARFAAEAAELDELEPLPALRTRAFSDAYDRGDAAYPDVSGGGVPVADGPGEKLCAAPGHVVGSWCVRPYGEPHMHEDEQGRKWGVAAVIAGDFGAEQVTE